MHWKWASSHTHKKKKKLFHSSNWPGWKICRVVCDLKTSSIPLQSLEAQLSSLSLVAVLLILVTIRPVKNVQKPGIVTVVRADLWEKEETWSSGVIYLSSVCPTAQLALHHGPWNRLTQVQTSICWYFLTPWVICASIYISVYKYTCFLSPECKVCSRMGVLSLYYHQSTATGDLTVS